MKRWKERVIKREKERREEWRRQKTDWEWRNSNKERKRRKEGRREKKKGKTHRGGMKR